MATVALELEKSGLSYQRIPAGYRFPYGPRTRRQEEVYVVVRGSGRMKLDDEIVELKEWDAVRVPPGTWRGYEAGPEGLEILVIGAPSLGDARREDVDGQRDWWADSRLDLWALRSGGILMESRPRASERWKRESPANAGLSAVGA